MRLPVSRNVRSTMSHPPVSLDSSWAPPPVPSYACCLSALGRGIFTHLRAAAAPQYPTLVDSPVATSNAAL